MTRGRACALVALLLLSAPGARANGRYPSAGLVVFDPDDARHLAVRTTFGLLESRDAAETFDFVCESALRLGVPEDPMLAFTASGPLVVATFGGVLTSDDGCSFRFVPELEGQVVSDLARSVSAPDTLVAFRSLGLGGGLYESGVVRSDDAGASWTRLPLLPDELLPVTVDLAATDPSRVYLTVRRGPDHAYDSWLLVSDDGGASFRSRGIPDTSEQRLAYVAAVHPSDRERLVLRVDDPSGTVLLETRDAGRNFERLFVGAGRLTGFALSPDGSQMAFGGADDGFFVRSEETGASERRSDLQPTCLAWNADGLWACADSNVAAFSLGRSTDGGRTFEPLFAFEELCGTSSCGAGTDVAALCTNDWESVAPTLGAACDTEPSPAPVALPFARGGCAVGSSASGLPGARGAALLGTMLFAMARRWRRARAGGKGSFRFRRGSPSRC